jgi:hypothetical protein
MLNLNRFLLQLMLCSGSIAFVSLTHAAGVPPLINYQGTLTDAYGVPIPDATKPMEFNIYDAPTGGNLIWGPQLFATVPIINGRFNVILGTTDSLGRSIANAFNAENRYLGIRAGSLTEIAPRQQILSTAYAMKAQRAAVSEMVTPSYDSGWFAENNSTTHVTTKTHNLGVYPTKVQVWFSETNPPTGFIVAVSTMTWGQQGGMESFRVSTTNIEYSIPANGDSIAHWWDGTTRGYSSGYYRILLWK